MKVAQFKALLLEFAQFLTEKGDVVAANGLRKLAELFDGKPEQEVAKLVASIRKARRL
jgi:hypothetical protein